MLEAELRATGQKMQARLVEGGTVISEQDVQLTRVAAGDLLCGVLSRSGPAFDFLPTLELPPPLRRARIAHIEVEDLPTQPQVLASLDCIIFDNIATTTMLDSQRDALTSWVYGGGLLVAIGGPTWQKTFSALPADLLPVKANGLVEPGEPGWRWPISAASRSRTPAPGWSRRRRSTDGNLVAEQDGVPLIAAARRGSGTVLYLAMDPTVEPLRSWAGTPRLWRYVLAHGAGSVGLGSAVSGTFTGWGRIPRNAMVDISTLSGPTPGLMMLALAVFAVVVGPLNYLFLLRFGRPGWSVVTIPLIDWARRDRHVYAGWRLPRQRRHRQQSRAGARRTRTHRPTGGPTSSVLSRRQATLAIRGNEYVAAEQPVLPVPA